LAGYGIPEQLLPLSNTGTVKTANHSRWINALRAKADRELWRLHNENYHYHGNNNSSNSNNNNPEDEEEIVDCPGSRDVIFRKGPTYKNNPGNMYFRELIEATHKEHTKASRKGKCRITWNILNEIEAQGGRFLDWSMSREMWVVAKDREKIRKKVAACYKQYNRTVLIFNLQQQKLQQQQQRQQQKRQQPPANSSTIPNSSDEGQGTETTDSGPTSLAGQQPPSANPNNSNIGKPPLTIIEPNPTPLFRDPTLTNTRTTTVVPINNDSMNNNPKVDRRLREYYDAAHMVMTNPSPSKRQKTFNLFCGYSSSSGESSGYS
jgi:hypothetical protein